MNLVFSRYLMVVAEVHLEIIRTPRARPAVTLASGVNVCGSSAQLILA